MRNTVWFIMLVCGANCARAGDMIEAYEMAAVAGCTAYAEAQEIYRRTDWDQDGLLEYSQSISGGKKLTAAPVDLSKQPKPTDEERKRIGELIPKLASDNFAEREAANQELAALGIKAIEQLEAAAKEHKDAEVVSRCKELRKAAIDAVSPQRSKELQCGLVFMVSNDTEQNIGLLDKAFADAEVTSLADIAAAKPKSGYLYRILTKQGKSATGGARSYLAGHNMTLGYAVLAFPKTYGETGKKVFMINNNGTVYQKDLGSKEKLEEFVKTFDTFDPDPTWTVTE